MFGPYGRMFPPLFTGRSPVRNLSGMVGDAPGPATRPVPPPGTLSPPTDAELLVWWADTGVSPRQVEALRADLDDETRARTNAMVREADRRRSIVAHGLLRRLVAACTGQPAADVSIVRICASCGSADHGKPALARGGGIPPLQFNLAHSGSTVAVALGGPATDVGVDVEAIRTDFDWLPARRHVFTDREWDDTAGAPDPSAARFALWARKEAAAKTTGHGLAIDLAHAAIDRDAGPGGARRGRLKAPERTYELLVTDVTLGEGTAAAVAVLGRITPPRVSVVRADLGD